MLEDASRSVKPAAFTQVRTLDGIEGYAVRFERWRLIEWSTGEQLLFDEEADPEESINLAYDPAFRAITTQLAEMLGPIRAQQ